MKRLISNILLFLGVALIVFSCIYMFYLHISQKEALKASNNIVSTIRSLIPENQNGYADENDFTDMPSVEINGNDFIGLIKVPAYDVILPIHSNWTKNALTSYPHRFSGSMYDGSLVIGGSDIKGQFDFTKYISIGDEVSVIDMTGVKFTYTVDDIITIKDNVEEAITGGSSDLILFSVNTYSFDYTVVFLSR